MNAYYVCVMCQPSGKGLKSHSTGEQRVRRVHTACGPNPGSTIHEFCDFGQRRTVRVGGGRDRGQPTRGSGLTSLRSRWSLALASSALPSSRWAVPSSSSSWLIWRHNTARRSRSWHTSARCRSRASSSSAVRRFESPPGPRPLARGWSGNRERRRDRTRSGEHRDIERIQGESLWGRGGIKDQPGGRRS